MADDDFGEDFLLLPVPGGSGTGPPNPRAGPDADPALADRAPGDDSFGQASGPENGPEQVDIPPPILALPERPRGLVYTQRSAAHAAHARAGKALRRAKQKAEETQQQLDTAQGAISVIKAVLPGAAALLGKPEAGTASLRRKALDPSAFLVLTRAAHLPSASKVQLGVKLQRLQCFSARCALARQSQALENFLAHSQASLAAAAGDGQAQVHVTYAHIWDEVQTQFKGFFYGKFNFRDSKQTVTTPTLVQRGIVGLSLCDTERQVACEWTENWLCAPVQVVSVTAGGLYAGLARSIPKFFKIDSLSAMEGMVGKATSFTFQPLCDRALSNVLILKHLAAFWESDLLAKGLKVLYWSECCGIHQHHRAKLQLKGLKKHTMRHFSIANLYRLNSIQERMRAWLEINIPLRVRRVVGAAPPADASSHNLLDFVDVLYDLQAEHHKRPNKKFSHRYMDLLELCRMANCDMLGGAWVHHCWDEGAGAPCCRSQTETEERAVVAVVNALLGGSDPIPAESRWTHLLSNMKRTLLRWAVFRVGIDCFNIAPPAAQDEAMGVDANEQGLDAFLKSLHKSRIQKTTEYYHDSRNIHELAVFCVLLEVCDSRLLYPLLGDPLRKGEAPPKLHMLHDRESSLIGACLQELLRLLEGWSQGGPRRRPWCVLDHLKAPAEDAGFARWARAQILRLSSAIFRRYEVQHSGYPFCLYPLISSQYTDAEKRDVAERLLAADRKSLDTYSHGLRTLFPTADGLMSFACVSIIRKDWEQQGYGTDCIERMNAEIVATTPRRAPGRNFAYAARESVLKQLANIHRQHGGTHPLANGVLAKCAPTEKVRYLPGLSAAPSALEAPPAQAADAGLRAMALEDDGERAVRPPAEASSSALAVFAGGPSQAPCVERPNPAVLVLSKPKAKSKSGPERAAPKQKVGLSPYMLEKNKYLQAARQARGAPLTPAERAQLDADFRAQWDRQREQGEEVFREAYAEWRRAESQAVAVVPEYKQIWGGGCHGTPLTKEEMFRYYQVVGWPTDAEVADLARKETMAQPDESMSFARGLQYDLWGRLRAARNVDPQTADDPAKFSLIEQGLVRFMEHLGKETADSAEVMFMIEGDNLRDPGTMFRIVGFLTGTSYSPKVCDVTLCVFAVEDDEFSQTLSTPCLVRLARRANRVSAAFDCLDTRTSSEFARFLAQGLGAMRLSSLTYEVPLEIDGSLNWSRIIGVEDLGIFWEDGERQPWGQRSQDAGRSSEHRSKKIASAFACDDPFADPEPQALVASKPRRATGKRLPRQQASASAAAEPRDAASANTSGGKDKAGEGGAAGTPDIPAPGPAQAMPEPMMDMVEDDNAALEEEDWFELAATYANETDEQLASAIAADDVQDRVVENLAPEPPSDDMIQAISAEVAEVSQSLGLAAPPADDDAPSGAASSSSQQAPPPPEFVAPPPQPEADWQRMSGGGQAGYIYLDGRSVMRIQRDNPPGRLTLNCFKHTRCQLLINLDRAPSDDELKQWFFEVEATPPTATQAEKKEMARRHLETAKARWVRKRPAPTAE